MHGVLGGIVAGGIVAETDLDPAALKPSPLSLAVFLFLAVATVLLLLSMLRHLRRARTNLGATSVARPPAGPTEGSSVGGTGPGEDDVR